MTLFPGALYVSLLNYSFIAIPLFCIALARKSYRPLIAAGLLLIAFAFDTIVLYMPLFAGLKNFSWNWEGKILELLWPLVIVYLFRWLTPEKVGYKLPRHNFGWILGIGLGLLFPLFVLIGYFLGIEEFTPPRTEDLLYQFTMPGLAEEPVYRGIFLVILNQYLGQQWRLFKVQIGWGVILTSVLFVMVHLIAFVPKEQKIEFFWEWPLPLSYHIGAVISIFIVSFGWGYLREKTGSLWPCILSHNLANGLSVLVKQIITI